MRQPQCNESCSPCAALSLLVLPHVRTKVLARLLCRYVHYRVKYRHYSGNPHYSTYCHYWLCPCLRAKFTGAIAATGTTQQVFLYSAGICTIQVNTGTIAAIGTTPHTAITGCSHVCHAISRALLEGNRHYSTGTMEGRTTTVLVGGREEKD